MDKNQLLLRLRRKKMGLLIADSRQTSGRSVKECARAMGVSLERFDAYEHGEMSPSLPELEAYAFFLNVPVERFWGREPLISEPEDVESEWIENIHQERDLEICQLIRNYREQNNLSIEELSQRSAISLEKMEEFETGATSIPMSELEMISQCLGINLDDLVDPNTMAGTWRTQAGSARQFLALPDDIKKFISQPVNLPYLELAMRLSNLSSDRLRGIAEGILEITL